jgi:hypothetical protein
MVILHNYRGVYSVLHIRLETTIALADGLRTHEGQLMHDQASGIQDFFAEFGR